MTFLTVVGFLLLAVALLSMIRLGLRAEYSSKGVSLALTVGSFVYKLYPNEREKKGSHKRKRRHKQSDGNDERKEQEKNRKIGGSFDKFKKLLRPVFKAVDELRRRLIIKNLEIEYTAAGADAARAAISYGKANATVGALLPLIENHFELRRREIKINLDYNTSAPTIYVCAHVSIAVWELVYIAAKLVIRLQKSGVFDKKADSADAIKSNRTVNNTEENMKERRNETNE